MGCGWGIDGGARGRFLATFLYHSAVVFERIFGRSRDVWLTLPGTLFGTLGPKLGGRSHSQMGCELPTPTRSHGPTGSFFHRFFFRFGMFFWPGLFLKGALGADWSQLGVHLDLHRWGPEVQDFWALQLEGAAKNEEAEPQKNRHQWHQESIPGVCIKHTKTAGFWHITCLKGSL